MKLVFTHSICPNYNVWPRVSVFECESGFYSQIDGGEANNKFCHKTENRGTVLGALCELLTDEYMGTFESINASINWPRVITSAICQYERG